MGAELLQPLLGKKGAATRKMVQVRIALLRSAWTKRNWDKTRKLLKDMITRARHVCDTARHPKRQAIGSGFLGCFRAHAPGNA